MTNYILKRLLLMIPTLFLVVLLAFLVLNLAPGSPAQAQMSQQGTESTEGQITNQSYQIFKRQFNLDKPVLLNTRFWLGETDVERELQVLVDSERPVCKPEGDNPDNCIPEEKEPDAGDVIDAQTQLTDWGDYIVPELFRIAKNHENLQIRRRALDQLTRNARADVVSTIGRDLTEAQKKQNRRAADLNDKLETWKVSKDASAKAIDRTLQKNWAPWLDKPDQRERFEISTAERLRLFFLDTRFAKYLGNLAQLDFGVSHVTKRPVSETLWRRVRYTIWLTLPALLLAFFISIPIGVWSATQRQTLIDQTVTTVLLILYSLPTFFTGLILLQYFAAGTPIPGLGIGFEWFPTDGFVGENPGQMTTLEYVRSVAWHLFLPVVCLTYPRLAGLSRYARTGIVDVIESDYIRTARAKGLPESMVIAKHAVRNGMIPTLTILGTQLPRLVGGSIVIEYIFEIPGMGMYLLDSIHAQDYNALMGILLVSAVLTLIGILISDISYALVDPRISFD